MKYFYVGVYHQVQFSQSIGSVILFVMHVIQQIGKKTKKKTTFTKPLPNPPQINN